MSGFEIFVDLTDGAEVKRGAERFATFMSQFGEDPLAPHPSSSLVEEVRRGAEPFMRLLKGTIEEED